MPSAFDWRCHRAEMRMSTLTQIGGDVFAVVVREGGEAQMVNESGAHLEENVLPRLRQATGFVTALWMTDRAGGTLNVLVFDSEEAGKAALERVRIAQRPDFMHLESAELYEVLARA